MIDRAVVAYKGTETDILYGVAIDCAVVAYKETGTDVLTVLYGVEMSKSIYRVKSESVPSPSQMPESHKKRTKVKKIHSQIGLGVARFRVRVPSHFIDKDS